MESAQRLIDEPRDDVGTDLRDPHRGILGYRSAQIGSVSFPPAVDLRDRLREGLRSFTLRHLKKPSPECGLWLENDVIESWQNMAVPGQADRQCILTVREKK